MARYVILGHGSFDPDTSYLPEVLVPTGTSLQFFSDAGQRLTLPNADYTEVAKVWDQVRKEGSPIPERWVTYNFTLYPDTTAGHRESAKAQQWDADVVFIESGKAYLCTGTEDTCPTPALNVEAQKGEVEADRWNHHCKGILGQLAGNELFWIACTSIEMEGQELPVLETASVRGPGLDEDLAWKPDGKALAAIAEKNGTNVKRTDDGDSIAVVAGGEVVLIGSGHPRRPADYLRARDDREEGLLWINKGGRFSRGSIEVEGISAHQDLVEEAVKAFSEKKVMFI